jgi:hypothetical protein
LTCDKPWPATVVVASHTSRLGQLHLDLVSRDGICGYEVSRATPFRTG